MSETSMDDPEDTLLERGAKCVVRSGAAIRSSQRLMDGTADVRSEIPPVIAGRGYANLAEWNERDRSGTKAGDVA
jgi:hypothetical protein